MKNCSKQQQSKFRCNILKLVGPKNRNEESYVIVVAHINDEEIQNKSFMEENNLIFMFYDSR